jgi:hypothetical protein
MGVLRVQVCRSGCKILRIHEFVVCIKQKLPFVTGSIREAMDYEQLGKPKLSVMTSVGSFLSLMLHNKPRTDQRYE